MRIVLTVLCFIKGGSSAPRSAPTYLHNWLSLLLLYSHGSTCTSCLRRHLQLLKRIHTTYICSHFATPGDDVPLFLLIQ